jgi:hypothetical protein
MLRFRGPVLVDAMSMRKVHLSTALFLLTFLLAYAVSAVEFAHRKWVPHPHWITAETRKLLPGITDARILAREWRGELTSVETPAGRLKFVVVSPLGRSVEVTYSIATGEAKVQTTTVSFLTTLAFIHVSHGAWAWAVGVFSVGLMVLGASGFYLWFKNRKERWTGVTLLVVGLGIPISLIVSMRQ